MPTPPNVPSMRCSVRRQTSAEASAGISAATVTGAQKGWPTPRATASNHAASTPSVAAATRIR